MRSSTSVLLAIALLASPIGCTSQNGPDANTGVFQTPEQASAARRAKLLQDWQEMAERIANSVRPDIKTTKGEGFSLHFAADGVEQNLDLTPLTIKLTSATGKEREPIRAYLAQKVPEFDRARLAKLGFEAVKPMLHPQLHNTRQTENLASPDTGQPPITNAVVIDLNWIPVVNWPNSQATTAVDPAMAAAWKISADQVSAAAMENLRKEFTTRSQSPIETTEFPGMGVYGSLGSGVDPAIILLPEFVAAVHKEWKTDGDLVLAMPSITSITVIQRKNEKLLNQMIPQWTQLYSKVPDPMIAGMIVANDKGLSLFSYAPPSTKPATGPATKPPYIVH